MFNKVKMYYKRPYMIIYFVFVLFLIKIKHITFIVANKLKNNQIKVGKKVVFQQKVIVSGEGQVFIGEKTIFGVKNGGGFKYGVIEIQPRTKNSKIIIGNHVVMNNCAFICSANSVIIGDNVLIGKNLNLMDFEAHGSIPSKRNEIGNIGEVIIEDNVWIGNNVTILKNVCIGKNSIIASGSVVLKGKYPSDCIIGGNPAKVVKQIC